MSFKSPLLRNFSTKTLIQKLAITNYLIPFSAWTFLNKRMLLQNLNYELKWNYTTEFFVLTVKMPPLVGDEIQCAFYGQILFYMARSSAIFSFFFYFSILFLHNKGSAYVHIRQPFISFTHSIKSTVITFWQLN